MKKDTILIVAAHPDDEVLGCGGTIAQLATAGHATHCLFMGGGKGSRYNDIKSPKLLKERVNLKEESLAAKDILGIKEIYFENFPDQRYDTVDFLDLVKAVIKIKNEVKPDIIFTHCRGDLNLDHRLTLEAVLVACRPLAQETTKTIFSFEIPSPTPRHYCCSEGTFSPNVFVDISIGYAKKIRAVRAYQSETRDYPHPRSIKALEARSEYWGSSVGLQKAEVFELIMDIK